MNRLTKLFLRLLVVTSILALTYPATANLSTVDAEKNGFGLEISMDGREPFTLSLSAEKRRQAILPVKDANTSAVKVISWVHSTRRPDQNLERPKAELSGPRPNSPSRLCL